MYSHFEAITESNYQQVARIYQQGMDEGNATFELTAPHWEQWNASHLYPGRIALFHEEVMTGWAALSKVSDRCVYQGVAEVSLYVDAAFRHQGIGSALMTELIRISEEYGIHSLMAGIFPENKASIALHQKNGFRIIGYRER
ncbi:MAG TPA: N-acetyltransferase family protein, partial [Chitinophagaceae bacterium]|nr:N-acetyltransferase family protein [Chitinophagaceae bacterium]